MAINSSIDLIEIASDGIFSIINPNCFSTILCIGTLGIGELFLEEEIVEVPVRGGGGIVRRKTPTVKRKKITARVIIDGKTYEDVAYTSNLKLALTDVSVSVNMNENKEISIKILLPEIKKHE